MKYEHIILNLLETCGLVSSPQKAFFARDLIFQEIDPDGSSRRFLRITQKGQPLCLAIIPASQQVQDYKEAFSTYAIGTHLQKCGVPVPEIYGWDKDTGIVVVEDLGNCKLFDIIQNDKKKKKPSIFETYKQLYRQSLEVLATMQFNGKSSFDTGWCWDTKKYDVELRFSRESMYFLKAFWNDYLGEEISEALIEECRDIASVLSGEEVYFLHRDFQSRNIMVKEDRIRIIDFQGARLGPLGYDLASLLIDPYVALPEEFQEEMVRFYMDLVKKKYSYDAPLFQKHYSYLSLQRNLQIVGAFSFLHKKRQKAFFQQYIVPSLITLHRRLGESCFSGYSKLKQCVNHSLTLMKVE